MVNGFIVRPVRPQDFHSWLPLWSGYNAFYGRHGDGALPMQVTQTTWERFFDPGESMRGLVAQDDDGSLLGLCHFLTHRSTIHLQPVCYAQDLFTIEPARGRGVGRALILNVYARASATGCARVYWHTHESNAAAMRLYDTVADKSGFVVYRHPLQAHS